MASRACCIVGAVAVVILSWTGAVCAGVEGSEKAVRGGNQPWARGAGASELIEEGARELMMVGSIVKTKYLTQVEGTLMAGYTLGGGAEIGVASSLARSSNENYHWMKVKLDALFIYNFQPIGRIVPFVQAGAGLEWHHREVRSAEGDIWGHYETDPRIVLGGGARVFVATAAAVVAQYRFERTFLDSELVDGEGHADQNGLYLGVAIYP